MVTYSCSKSFEVWLDWEIAIHILIIGIAKCLLASSHKNSTKLQTLVLERQINHTCTHTHTHIHTCTHTHAQHTQFYLLLSDPSTSSALYLPTDKYFKLYCSKSLILRQAE